MSGLYETLRFQHYRTHSGEIARVDLYRRNGRPAFSLRPDATDDERSDDPDPYIRWRAVLAANLTEVEEGTWYRLLSGHSVARIAADDGVKRAAVYCRIRGKGGTGGMVGKNKWVSLWWRRRQTANA